MLQETHLPDEETATVPGYIIHREHTLPGTRKGGLSILIRPDIPCHKVNVNTELTVQVMRIESNYPFTLCNVYLSSECDGTQNNLDRLVQQLPNPMILAGDWNAHSLSWNSSKNDPRGRVVESFIDRWNLCLSNEDHATYMDTRSGKTDVLDLAISSVAIARVSSFHALNDLYGSDHFPICVTLFPDVPRPTPLVRWAIGKADWDSFRNYLLRLPARDHSSFENAQELQNYLTKSILDAAEMSIPTVAQGRGRPLVPWWNEECKKALKERRKAFRRFQRNSIQENLILFRQARAKCKLVFSKAKLESWRAYISSINQNTPSGTIWRKMKTMAGKYTPTPQPTIKRGPNIISDSKQVADLLATHFSEVSSNESYNLTFQTIKEKSEKQPPLFNIEENSHDYNNCFTSWELEAALKTLKPTSPGLDQVHNLMLKNLPPSFKVLVLALFNQVWTTGLYPHEWRIAILVPVSKPGKDRHLPDSYRPIALTNTLGKLLEKMVNFRLMWELESKNLLAPWQSGFRKNRSTLDNLVSLEASILDGFLLKKETIVVFFDCEKAYDKVWRYGILKALKDFGFNGRLAVYIQNFLSDRKFQVRVGSELSTPHCQENGVPQGAVLSVTLFLLAINTAASLIGPPVKLSLFVDDLALIFSSKKCEDSYILLQKNINKLEQWALNMGLTFSATKTNYILFSRRHKPSKVKLSLGGRPLIQVPHVKYLGLTLDSRFTWTNHIEQLRSKCLKDLNLLRIVGGYSWGADRITLLRLYRQLIRSKLDYGSIIYGSAKEKLLCRLNAIHNSGIRIATGAFKTTPIESLLVESNEPSLIYRRDLLLMRYRLRVQESTNNPVTALFTNPELYELYNENATTPRPAYIRCQDAIRNYNTSQLHHP